MSNQLFYGDNLEVLQKHIKDESVDLCYIDPPFNSKRNYNQIYNNVGKEDQAQAQAFVDTWTWDDHANQGLAEISENYHGRFTRQSVDLIAGLTKVLGKGSLLAYLVSMTLRVAEIHRVLKPTGSFYLHCDPSASHYLKIILDAIFCAQGGDYCNEIIWLRHEGHNDAKRFGRVHDIILSYQKSNNRTFNTVFTPYSQEQLSRYKKDEQGRLYRAENLTGAGHSANRSIEWRGVSPGNDRHWMWSIDEMERLFSEGRILLRKDGKPRKDGYKAYLDEMPGKPANDVWADIPRISNTSAERLGYPTQKPEALLERIIKASSNEGDVILDAYCGCGTTIAVAERLNRTWIGIDITYQSISLILKRLEDSFGKNVLDKIQLNGIPKDMASAQALALKADDRTRKEFEKWAVLTYSNNRAVINAKKGADKGIDGVAYFQGDQDTPDKIIFQVKSGKVKAGDIRDLQGTMTLNEAAIGIFITLQTPTKDMMQTAKMAGIYQSRYMSQNVDKIQIVTIQEIIEDKKRLDIRLMFEVLKSAEKQRETQSIQIPLDI
jgi:site-specific DNA-methyltransferase (adenine-specific)